jgi:hypothetical protein
MKKIIFLGLIVSLTIGIYAQGSQFPQGAWRGISCKHYLGGSVAFDFPGVYTGGSVKIWAVKNVNDIGRFKHDTTVINLYFGGTYKLEGDRYEETVLYHWIPDVVGKTTKMLLQLRNDTLIQTYPVDDKGEIDINNYEILKFVRIK